MPTCKICNRKFKRLTASHLKTHNISMDEYREKYGHKKAVKRCTYQNIRSDWQCRHFIPADSDSDSDLCILHEPGVDKDVELFEQTLKATIQNHANDPTLDAIHLEGTHFPVDFLCRFDTFGKFFDARDAVYHGKFDLSKSRFEKGADFGRSTFRKTVMIRSVVFEEITKFSRSTFEGKVEFNRAEFWGVTFAGSHFHQRTAIRHSIFHNFTSFRFTKTPEPQGFLAFYFNRFPSGRETWFEDNDMSKVSLNESDLRFARFINVDWVQPSWPGTSRKCLVDEFKNYEDKRPFAEHLNRVRSSYQQLKLNFEESRNFSDAGDFYYGEMECRRKALGNRRFLPNLTTLYWLSTGYGERPLRAGLMLAVVTIGWILLLMFGGLQPGKADSGYDNIHYLPRFDISQSQPFIDDFFDTFSYVREILLREEKSDRIFAPIISKDSWIDGNSINTIGFVIVYLQVLLLILAIRRRYRR